MTQAGVLVYKVNEDAMDPLVFWLIEEWSSSSDLANHCSSTTYAGISARCVPTFSDKPIILKT